MKLKRILFPVDFSKFSDAGLPFATSLARDSGADLIILHVQEPATAYTAGEWYYGPIAPDPEMLREALEKIRPTDPSVPCVHQIVLGNPAAQIVSTAENEGVDMIVMSTRGRTGVSRALMGSVAENVVRRANCPVVVVKQPPKKD
jgi:universal stress protein A